LCKNRVMPDPPFSISHLHRGEQDRIREGRLNPYEQEMLAKNEDPWAKFRVSDKDDTGTPEATPTPPPDPSLPEVKKSKGMELSELSELFEGTPSDEESASEKRSQDKRGDISELLKQSDATKSDIESLTGRMGDITGGDVWQSKLAEIQKQLQETLRLSDPHQTLANSVRKIAEKMAEDRKSFTQRFADALKPPPPPTWSEFYRDPTSGKVSIRHDPTDDEEYPPDLVEYSETLKRRQKEEEEAKLAGIERAVYNAIKKADEDRRSESKWDAKPVEHPSAPSSPEAEPNLLMEIDPATRCKQRPDSRIRRLGRVIISRDREIHDSLMRRFPRLLRILDWVLGFLFGIVSANVFGIIIGLLIGIVLVVTGAVDVTVFISVGIAWLVAVIWVARSESIKRLSILSRAAVTLLSAAVLASLFVGFGGWALRQYRKRESQKVEAKPSPSPERPDFELIPWQTWTAYYPLRGKTRILFDIEIKNSGAPSIATDWLVHYHSETFDGILHFIRFQDENQPVIFPMSPNFKPGDSGIEYWNDRAINTVTAITPVTKEKPVRARLLLNVPGNKSEEIRLGLVQFTLSVKDYLGREHVIKFHPDGSSLRSLTILPTDKIVPIEGRVRREK
jgi:hypothetical protein